MTREELIGIAESDMRAIGKSLGMTPEAVENVIARSGIRATLVTVEEQRERAEKIEAERHAATLEEKRRHAAACHPGFADDWREREAQLMRENARTQVVKHDGVGLVLVSAEKPADLGDDMIGEAFDLYAED